MSSVFNWKRDGAKSVKRKKSTNGSVSVSTNQKSYDSVASESLRSVPAEWLKTYSLIDVSIPESEKKDEMTPKKDNNEVVVASPNEDLASDDGRYHQQQLKRTRSNSFLEDLVSFEEGTIPQSFVVALVVGVVCGVAAWIYYMILFNALEFFWHTLPTKYLIGTISPQLYCLWIPFIGIIMAVGLGVTVKYLGEPGDLAYTIKCVHEKGYISMDHVLPMVCASQFSILGGGSLGPEAPLVAICAALGGFVSRHIFFMGNRNVIRKHTLMGMSGALAAFFGSPLGGSLFALEVNSRFGIEYFEHAVESIFCGGIVLGVFRWLAGLPISPIWNISSPKLSEAVPSDILIGAGIGLLGAGIATIFAYMHWKLMDWFQRRELLRNEKAIQRALIGSSVIVTLGMLFPYTMFWGEYEFQTIATLSNNSQLPHVWPTAGLFGFDIQNGFHALIVGVAKLVAISFTVSGGYRGGFIFPFFSAGAALGRVLHAIFPSIPVPLACLGLAAAINVSITRTALSTSIILCFLSGEQNAMTGVLMSSLVALFATGYMPFIKSQQLRNDLGIHDGNSNDEKIVNQRKEVQDGYQNESSPLVV